MMIRTLTMKSAIIAILLPLLLPTTLQAQSGLLWRITSPDGAINHLFGTIHLADTLVFQQPTSILAALDTSLTFIAELDLDSVRAQGMNIRAMMASPGTSLRQVLHDTDYAAVKQYVTQNLGGMVAMTMDGLKPGIIASMILMGRMERTAPESVDEFLWKRAKELGLPALGIESASEQLTALDAMPPDAIVELVRNPEAFDSLHKVLRSAYIDGNLDEIAAAMSDLDQYESFASTINDNRNVVMADRLDEYLKRGGTFVAVGAAHIPGPKGIVALLRSKGYSVTPVPGTERHSMLKVPLSSYTPGKIERTTR